MRGIIKPPVSPSEPTPKAQAARRTESQKTTEKPVEIQASADPRGRVVRETHVHTVSQLISELEKLDYVKKGLWFRGTGNASYQLLPSLFRNTRVSNQVGLKKLEHDLNEMFRIRSVPYIDKGLAAGSDWDRLFFMQHYRIPTRLLDWSGSPLVSLHFAVTSVALDNNGKPNADVAVWTLDPAAWNNAAYADTNFSGGILSARDSWLKRYEPDEVYTQPNGLPPVALRGTHNSPRIVAQQGYFTVFGPRPDPMEKAYCAPEGPAFPNDCLVKFVIPKNEVLKMRDEIFALGISESTIYPDLEGLAAELKRNFGF